jgi:hypothetical protein
MLGCLEAALDQITAAVAGMGCAAGADRHGEPELQALFERLGLQFALVRSTCGAVREATEQVRPARRARSPERWP